MEYSDSYYDWELRFRKKNGKPSASKSKNSLGINESVLKRYLKEWRARNLNALKNRDK